MDVITAATAAQGETNMSELITETAEVVALAPETGKTKASPGARKPRAAKSEGKWNKTASGKKTPKGATKAAPKPKAARLAETAREKNVREGSKTEKVKNVREGEQNRESPRPDEAPGRRIAEGSDEGDWVAAPQRARVHQRDPWQEDGADRRIRKGRGRGTQLFDQRLSH